MIGTSRADAARPDFARSTGSARMPGAARPSARCALRRLVAALLAATLLASLSPIVSAQPVPASDGTGRTPPIAEDSPRASVAAYLELCRQGRFEDAARYLHPVAGTGGPLLAQRLKAVLDRHVWFDLDALSPASEGQLDDALPAGTDEIGSIPGASGQREPVRLVRLDSDDRLRWVFSSGTVARIEDWYDGLGDRWLHERLPPLLLRPGPKDLLWWQWLALPLLVGVSWGIGRLLGGFTQGVLGRAFSQTSTHWDNVLLERLAAPLTCGWALAIAALSLPALGLYAPAQRFLVGGLGAAGSVTLFWGIWRAVDVAGAAVSASSLARDSASARSMLSVGVRSGKVAVLAAGAVAALAQLGYPVASLVAGLGLGGLALALAAQKTVEHFFGSVSLAVDQPFRVGDFVRVEDFVGTVEAIGLRSTRFRTLDRTLIAIPNGKLADQRLESFTARDRMRLACTVGVEYGTSAAQMRQILDGLEAVLRAQPLIWPDAVVVRFKELAACSLDIEVMAWFQTADWSEFQRIRQEVLLLFMEVVEGAGASFAFPTRTVHMVKSPPRRKPIPLQGLDGSS